MDDLAAATANSNSNSSSNNSNSNSSTGVSTALSISNNNSNGLSYYELALKKLNQILKSKANDVTKQLDELWDSINHSQPSVGTQKVASIASKPATSNGKTAGVANSNSGPVRTSPTNNLVEEAPANAVSCPFRGLF